MTPGNYSIHAVEDLARLYSLLRFSERKADVLVMAMKSLRDAPKFLLPPEGRFLERWGGALEDTLTLPFPVFVCEYSCESSRSDPDRGMVRSSRRIAIVAEDKDKPGSIVVWPVSYIDDIGRYVPSPCVAMVTMSPTTKAAYVHERTDGRYPIPNPSGLVPAMDIRVLLPDLMRSMNLTPEGMAHDLTDECSAVACLLEALSCSNVRREVIAASAKLNRKRVAAGRAPFDDYHVLAFEPLEERHARGSAMGGTHASPRLHIRRGHIRVYQSGKRVFVRQHFVGDASRGRVLKDYRVQA